MMSNNVYLPLFINGSQLTYKEQFLTSDTRNFWVAQFELSDDWQGIAPIAIFKQGDIELEAPIIGGECQVPNEFNQACTFTVSVYGGDRRTTNAVTIRVRKSGFIDTLTQPPAPEPTWDWVRTVDGKIAYIRDNGGAFEYSLDGVIWRQVQGGGSGTGGDISTLAWLPNIDVDSNISWTQSTSTTAPAIRNIKGEQGEQGIQGEQGEQGIQGEQGLQGIQGEQGEQGIQGEQGEQGIQGEQGEQGIQGEQGEQGIQGEQGEQGIQGEQGLQGIQGEQGEQGIQGEQGEQGADGITPIKGVDYFTEQDIDLIVNNVLSRIPVDTFLQSRLEGN